ncbi:MAG: MFS transporter [Planctomycetaceae bacterium]
MALSDSRWQRTLTLCALYVAQGVPWGFMLLTLPNYLIDEYGLSTTAAGYMTAWILVPWSFKLIWAPLMDTYTIRSMGRRRPWIIGAELMMAVTLLGFVGMGNPSQNLQLIVVMYVLHNCFASLQDVCTDALAVDVLPVTEYGQMNGLMWGSKLVGKGIGAWGLSLVIEWGGLEACVAVQIAILLGIMIIPLLILERPGEKRFPWSAGRVSSIETDVCPMCGAGVGPSATACDACGEVFAGPQPPAENVRKPSEVLAAYLKAFSVATLLIFVAFTVSKLIGIGVYEIVRKTLYIKHLGWTHYELTTATGAYATIPIILGAIVGGILADRFGRRLILCVGFGGFGLVAMIFAACPELWGELWFSMSFLLLSETLNAVASVGFLSMAMRISWTKSAAIVFTTYMTLSNVSHVIGNAIAGWVQESFEFPDVYGGSATMASYEFTFWFIGVITLLPLALLPFVRVEQVDRAREAEGSLRADETPA